MNLRPPHSDNHQLSRSLSYGTHSLTHPLPSLIAHSLSPLAPPPTVGALQIQQVGLRLGASLAVRHLAVLDDSVLRRARRVPHVQVGDFLFPS